MAATGSWSSTHDLGTSSQVVRLLPQAPAGPADLDGRSTAYKLLLQASYDEEMGHVLGIGNLEVSSRNGEVLAADFSLVGAYLVPSAITDIHVAELGSGPTQDQVLVTAGTATGSVLSMRLLLPRTPGATPDDIQLITLPVDEEDTSRLVPQIEGLHAGAVRSVHVQSDTQALLTVGADGSIFVVDVEAQQGMQDDIAPYVTNPAGCVAYNNGRWTGATSFATVSVLGGLQVWDCRAAGRKPAAASPAGWGPTGSGTAHGGDALSGPACCTWLHSHLARPDLVATGATGGEVAVWDLRLTAQPLVTVVPDQEQGNDVWEVRFSPTTSGGGTTHPGVLYCTEGGTLGITAGAAGGQRPTGSGGSAPGAVLHQGPHSVRSLDVCVGGGGQGVDVVAVTDGQRLVYVHRAGL